MMAKRTTNDDNPGFDVSLYRSRLAFETSGPRFPPQAAWVIGVGRFSRGYHRALRWKSENCEMFFDRDLMYQEFGVASIPRRRGGGRGNAVWRTQLEVNTIDGHEQPKCHFMSSDPQVDHPHSPDCSTPIESFGARAHP